MNDSDDDALEALLFRPVVVLPDAGFTAAVMARMQALPAPYPPASARARLDGLRASAQREARLQRRAVAGGTLLAVLIAVAGAPTDALAQPGALALGLTVTGLVLAWSLLREPLA